MALAWCCRVLLSAVEYSEVWTREGELGQSEWLKGSRKAMSAKSFVRGNYMKVAQNGQTHLEQGSHLHEVLSSLSFTTAKDDLRSVYERNN